MRNLIRRLFSDRQGAALAEFAIIAPVLVALALGVTEIGRYSLLGLKVQNATTNMGDLTTRSENLTATEISNLYTAAELMLQPFEIGPNSRIIVTAIIPDPGGGGGGEVAWQISAGGTLSVSSLIGIEGGTAALPTGFTLSPDHALIVVETFYAYEPWLLEIVPATTINHQAWFRPRAGTLMALDPSV